MRSVIGRVLHVTRITHRNDPVLRGARDGIRPWSLNEESVTDSAGQVAAGMCSTISASRALPSCGDAGPRQGADVTLASDLTVVSFMFRTETDPTVRARLVQIDKSYHGHPQRVAAALWGTGPSPCQQQQKQDTDRADQRERGTGGCHHERRTEEPKR